MYEISHTVESYRYDQK